MIREVATVFRKIRDGLVASRQCIYFLIRNIVTLPDNEIQWAENQPLDHRNLANFDDESGILWLKTAVRVLEKVRVEKGSGDAAAEKCSICLEELLKGLLRSL